MTQAVDVRMTVQSTMKRFHDEICQKILIPVILYNNFSKLLLVKLGILGIENLHLAVYSTYNMLMYMSHYYIPDVIGRVFRSQMVKNALAAGAPSRTPLGTLQRSQAPSWNKEKGKEGKGKGKGRNIILLGLM